MPANGGHGLVGMRERVTLYGGRLTVGPRADGGFAVLRVAAAGRGGLMGIGVLVVDDQPLVRAGLRKVFEVDPAIDVLGEAADGRAALTEALRLRPQVVVMDIRMPGMDGLEATRRLARGGPDGPAVLVLTTFDLDEYVFEALRAGASGFLLKDAPPEDLLAAVHTVAGGAALLAPAVTRRVIERFASLPPAAPSWPLGWPS